MIPRKAYGEALKNGGSDKLRAICCKNPKYAFYYARDVDRCSREDTRKAACQPHYFDYAYSLYMEKRVGVCNDPWFAYLYAVEIDKGYHEETRRSCYKYSDDYILYIKAVLKFKYYKELELLSEIKRVNHGS